ncbi:DinB family protein [Geminicoccaceae bacterium 1502E]|nr:DinB family protein [Geminicoccaceae bacterium 1502E]
MRKELFNRFAAYNAWANRRLLDACARLGEGEWQAARPSFFGSIHRTLNHLMVGDRLWLARLEGESLTLRLDALLHEDLPGFRGAREALDARIVSFVNGVDEAGLDAVCSYRASSGEPFADRVVEILQHLFNHQTHHRGQVHGMLSATAVDPPPLDLVYFMRETPQAANSPRV